MKRSTILGSVAGCFCLTASLLAADPLAAATTTPTIASEKSASDAKPAEKCLSDLRAFDSQMEKDGYWLSGSGFGYGYPINGPGLGYPMAGYSTQLANNYPSARPGYEVRILVASANILAQHGQQQPCEAVLATTRDAYKLYLAGIHSRGVPTADVPTWRRQQIADAQPVSSKLTSFRSDEPLGTDVRSSPSNEALGSIDDIVMRPQTGAIAYLVIGRGGIFGLDEKYFPVPWAQFRISGNGSLLVLDITKSVLDAAPQVTSDQITAAGHFDQETQKIDAYWKAQLAKQNKN